MWRHHPQTRAAASSCVARARSARCGSCARRSRSRSTGRGDVRWDAGARRRGADGRRVLLRQRRAAAAAASRPTSRGVRRRASGVDARFAGVDALRRRRARDVRLRLRPAGARRARGHRRRTGRSSSTTRGTRASRSSSCDGDASSRSRSSAPNSYRLELEDVSAAIRDGRPPLLGREDAVGQARVLEALLRHEGRDRRLRPRRARSSTRRSIARGRRARRRGRSSRRTPSARRGRGARTRDARVVGVGRRGVGRRPRRGRDAEPLPRAARARGDRRGVAGRRRQAARADRRRGRARSSTRPSEAGVPLTVFQNRRWDGDFLTAAAARRTTATLGDVVRFESRFERFRPEVKQGWRELGDPAEGGGQLLDLGSHLVDQARVLFGHPLRVYAEVARGAARRARSTTTCSSRSSTPAACARTCGWARSRRCTGRAWRSAGCAAASPSTGSTRRRPQLADGHAARATPATASATTPGGSSTRAASASRRRSSAARYEEFYAAVRARARRAGRPARQRRRCCASSRPRGAAPTTRDEVVEL